MNASSLCILGCGNIGSSIAKGLVKSGTAAKNITLTRRKPESLAEFKKAGFQITDDNSLAVKECKIILMSVGPSQLMDLLDDITPHLTKDHLLVSIVSGIEIAKIQEKVGTDVHIVRAMPNTAAVLCESMTCLSSLEKFDKGLKTIQTLFNNVGQTLIIDEEQMASATALCACGVAFFLRAIRAASQGGIEIGFHSDEAFTIAAQTARGAATLLLDNDAHPEAEIDRVTTPMGATIAGLNEMEHQGFSSSMIKGITTSTEKVRRLFNKD
ncbi:MAG: pyrroline-5-carboxylate reductase [Candidatus Marinimicrobia bacterium]|jgi:pyrroline-5-carboxylate reductase|nr:pyrroline-5-carboxylate reductase [Candidatus Neomarinimicrobiota bacterium]|tara:strand:+ start:125 stop:931 length:807 start_codon:yes stop_codon:yes gene_type:complete